MSRTYNAIVVLLRYLIFMYLFFGGTCTQGAHMVVAGCSVRLERAWGQVDQNCIKLNVSRGNKKPKNNYPTHLELEQFDRKTKIRQC